MPICDWFFRKGEGCPVPRPEGFRRKASPDAIKRMKVIYGPAMDSIELVKMT
jgi:hypothetical protein